MLRACAYIEVFPEKICQSATEGLYRIEVQTDMRVADLWQIVENVADCGRLWRFCVGAGTLSFRHHPTLHVKSVNTTRLVSQLYTLKHST